MGAICMKCHTGHGSSPSKYATRRKQNILLKPEKVRDRSTDCEVLTFRALRDAGSAESAARGSLSEGPLKKLKSERAVCVSGFGRGKCVIITDRVVRCVRTRLASK